MVRAGDNRADTVAVEPWLAKARRASGPGKGVWTTLTIAGKRTGYQLPAWVYVPDAYFDPAQSTRQYPVVELFDGYPGAPTTWDRQGHLPAMLDRLIAANRIPPMIFIAPTQNPTAGRDSECVDAVGGARADTYLTQDVPDAVIGHLRVTADRTAWSTMGYSTGGYCAVDLALRHPREYASAVSLDGYFSPAIDATTGDLFKHDATVQRGYTPAATIHDRRAVPLRFYLLLGDAEPRVGQAGRTFAAAVTPPDTVTVVNIPGGHNWGTWTSALPAALAWLAAALPDNAPDAAPSTPAPTGSRRCGRDRRLSRWPTGPGPRSPPSPACCSRSWSPPRSPGTSGPPRPPRRGRSRR